MKNLLGIYDSKVRCYSFRNSKKELWVEKGYKATYDSIDYFQSLNYYPNKNVVDCIRVSVTFKDMERSYFHGPQFYVADKK